MKITRVKQISFFPTKDMFEEVEVQLHQDFGDSVADFSSFVPTSESVRSLPAGDIGLQYYDYPDGKDDGKPVPIGRRRGADIAEISEEVLKQQSSVKKQFDDYMKNQLIDNAINNSVSQNGNSETQ